MRGRIHKVKINQIIYTKRFEHQNHIGQVGPLNLGYRILFQLMLEGVRREESLKKYLNIFYTAQKVTHRFSVNPCILDYLSNNRKMAKKRQKSTSNDFYSSNFNYLKHLPGATRPALPALWLAEACEAGETTRDSMPVRALKLFCFNFLLN